MSSLATRHEAAVAVAAAGRSSCGAGRRRTEGYRGTGRQDKTTWALAGSLGNEERYGRGGNQSLVVSRRSHWKADARVARRALFAEGDGQHSTKAPGHSKQEEFRMSWRRAASSDWTEAKGTAGQVVSMIAGGVDSLERKTDVKQAQTNASRCRKLRRPLEEWGSRNRPRIGQCLVENRLAGQDRDTEAGGCC